MSARLKASFLTFLLAFVNMILVLVQKLYLHPFVEVLNVNTLLVKPRSKRDRMRRNKLGRTTHLKKAIVKQGRRCDRPTA